MIKGRQVFFLTSNLNCHGFHGDKATIFYLTSEYYSLPLLPVKLYFIEIGPVHQKLWPFKCMMLKTMNSNFLDSEDTLNKKITESEIEVANLKKEENNQLKTELCHIKQENKPKKDQINGKPDKSKILTPG